VISIVSGFRTKNRLGLAGFFGKVASVQGSQIVSIVGSRREKNARQSSCRWGVQSCWGGYPLTNRLTRPPKLSLIVTGVCLELVLPVKWGYNQGLFAGGVVFHAAHHCWLLLCTCGALAQSLAWWENSWRVFCCHSLTFLLRSKLGCRWRGFDGHPLPHAEVG